MSNEPPPWASLSSKERFERVFPQIHRPFVGAVLASIRHTPTFGPDDMCQEVICKFIAQVETFRWPDTEREALLAVMVWCTSTKRRTLIQWLRNRIKTINTEEPHEPLPREDDLLARADKADEIAILQVVIGQLDPRDGAIIRLHINGMKSPEIADHLGSSLTPAGVRTRLARALAELEESLRHDYPGLADMFRQRP